jgi:LEA14-like dessication related protein
MNKGVKIALWTLVAAIGRFGVYAGIAVKGLMAICYNIVKYEARIDLQFIYLKLTLKIKNPSILKMDIDGYNLSVYLNNKWVANVESKTHVEMKSEAISTIVIPVKIDFLKTYGVVGGKEIVNAFLRKEFDKIFINVAGRFDGTVMKYHAHVPVDYKITLTEILKIMSSPDTDPCQT